jgi:hypothetical protein
MVTRKPSSAAPIAPASVSSTVSDPLKKPSSHARRTAQPAPLPHISPSMPSALM